MFSCCNAPVELHRDASYCRLHISCTDSWSVMWSKFNLQFVFVVCLRLPYVLCVAAVVHVCRMNCSSWILSWLPSWCPTSPSQLKDAEEKMLKCKRIVTNSEWFVIRRTVFVHAQRICCTCNVMTTWSRSRSPLLQVWKDLFPGSMCGSPVTTTCGPWLSPPIPGHALLPAPRPRPDWPWFSCMVSEVGLPSGPKTWTLSPAADRSTL